MSITRYLNKGFYGVLFGFIIPLFLFVPQSLYAVSIWDGLIMFPMQKDMEISSGTKDFELEYKKLKDNLIDNTFVLVKETDENPPCRILIQLHKALPIDKEFLNNKQFSDMYNGWKFEEKEIFNNQIKKSIEIINNNNIAFWYPDSTAYIGGKFANVFHYINNNYQEYNSYYLHTLNYYIVIHCIVDLHNLGLDKNKFSKQKISEFLRSIIINDQ
ncbi:MAG: hypothetical protein II961_07240 [Candidatus Riflebacteria bacterium]|nr:hypothetical protein [Candidatus Riflebacteria bacterium]